GRLDRVLAARSPPELLGNQHLEQPFPAPGQLLGDLVRLLLAEPLELVVEGYLLPLLLGVLLDLPALLFDVGVGDLGDGPLGEEGPRRHRERRGDGAGEPCGAYEVRAPRGPGDAGDDAEDRSKAVVGAVDGPRDPAGS